MTTTAQPQTASGGLPERMGRNVGVNYLCVAVVSLSALVVTPVMLALLGPAGFGIWVLAGSVVSYLELFDLGFGVATIKLVAEDAYRRPAAVIRTLNTNLLALTGLAVVGLVAGLGVAVLAPRIFDVPTDLRTDTVVLFAALAVSFAVAIPFDTLGGVLAGYQRYDLLSVSNMVLNLVTAAAGIAVVALGGGLIGVAVVSAATSMGTHVLRFRMAAKLVPGLRLSPRLADRSRLRSTASLSGWFLVRDVTNIVINRVDLLVVGVLLGVRAVAVYAVALKLAQLGRRAMLPLSQVFFPHASSLAADRDARGLGLLLVEGTRVSMLVATPIMLVLTLLAGPALTAWVGTGYADAVLVLVLLAVARGLTAVTDTAWWLLAGADKVKVTALVAVVESVVNLGVSVGLAPSLGVVGVAVGTLTGVALVGLPAAMVLSSRATGVGLARVFTGSLLPHLVPSAVVAGALVAVRGVLPAAPAPVVGVAAVAFAGYLAVFLLFAGSRSERERVRELAGKVRRRVPVGR